MAKIANTFKLPSLKAKNEMAKIANTFKLQSLKAKNEMAQIAKTFKLPSLKANWEQEEWWEQECTSQEGRVGFSKQFENWDRIERQIVIKYEKIEGDGNI